MKIFKYKKVLFIILIIIIIISSLLFYSRYIATSGLKVKEYKIVNANIPNSFYGAKIVHLSDIHYGRTINKKELTKIVNEINLLKPDIVILTGDILDKDRNLDTNQKEELISILTKINVTIDKYAISGNHDNDTFDEIVTSSGFINLNNSYDSIYYNGDEPIFIAGISSNYESTINIKDKFIKTEEYLNPLEEKPKYKILILHEPDYIDDIDYSNFDLILAGHSHNGQVRIPFIGATILPKGAKKYYDESYQLNNTSLYVSSGLGTSKINFRFLNKPSFNLYRLVNK